jgi:hypothetical protein
MVLAITLAGYKAEMKLAARWENAKLNLESTTAHAKAVPVRRAHVTHVGVFGDAATRLRHTNSLDGALISG